MSRRYLINSLIMSLMCIVLMSGCNRQSKHIKARLGEKYRPQVHFSPETGWMSSISGLVHYKGEYHLFYQYNPDSTVGGPMSLGHAVSRDLIHWKNLPTALKPDRQGYILSGSTVIDKNNTSGFGKKGIPPMVTIFTYHNAKAETEGEGDYENQGIAFSLDEGRTWTKYNSNPILKNPGGGDFRDPHVIWDEEAQKWIMILAAVDHIKIYSSANLKDWTFESDFGTGIGSHQGAWRFPDLFPIKVEGTNETKWVLLVSVDDGAPNGGSGIQYFVGDFDGENFVPHGEKTKWIDYGEDNYAGSTCSDISAQDGRTLFIGCMNNRQYANQVPTTGWRGACTIPRTIKLYDMYNEYLLITHPVKEFSQLNTLDEKLPKTMVSGESDVLKPIKIPFEAVLTFNTEQRTSLNFAERFGIQLSNDAGEKVSIGYDNLNKLFFIDRSSNGWESSERNFAQIHYAPYINNESTLKFRLIVDKSSIELFAVDGLVVMSEQVYPSQDLSKFSVFTEKGNVELLSGKITELSEIW